MMEAGFEIFHEFKCRNTLKDFLSYQKSGVVIEILCKLCRVSRASYRGLSKSEAL